MLGHIGKLTDFPRRGTMRDDLRSGLQTIVWRRCVIIASAVQDTAVVQSQDFLRRPGFRELGGRPILKVWGSYALLDR